LIPIACSLFIVVVEIAKFFNSFGEDVETFAGSEFKCEKNKNNKIKIIK